MSIVLFKSGASYAQTHRGFVLVLWLRVPPWREMQFQVHLRRVGAWIRRLVEVVRHPQEKTASSTSMPHDRPVEPSVHRRYVPFSIQTKRSCPRRPAIRKEHLRRTCCRTAVRFAWQCERSSIRYDYSEEAHRVSTLDFSCRTVASFARTCLAACLRQTE